MVWLVEKRIYKIQYKDLTMERICRFYECEDNKYTIVMIYDGEEYYTHIEFMELMPFFDEKDLFFYLSSSIKNKCVDSGREAKKNAERILERGYGWIFLKGSLMNGGKTAKFYTDRFNDDDIYIENLVYVKNKLKEQYINTCFVRIPQMNDLSLKEIENHSEWRFSGIITSFNWSKARERTTRKYLKYFTELEYEIAKIKAIKRPRACSYNEERWGERTIYLVGPCIVGGWEAFEGEALCDTLHECLEKEGMNYKIVNVHIAHSYNSNIRKILEYNINQNDVVIFIDEFDKNAEVADLDISYVFSDYRGNEWLYADRPIHTTHKGNELVSHEIVERIIKPISNISEIRYDHKRLHVGELQFTPSEDVEIQEYLNELKKYKFETNSIIGACVMTCNPFTSGHYYLIEYASRQVDVLYVFVVEEDKFFFPFEDRIEMVRRGTENLSNVIVVPSGKYIISQATFKNYFEKEWIQDSAIEAQKDVMIFKMMGRILGITKRFVGEEPDDKITNQYNQMLKRELSSTMEIIEIPRKKIRVGEVISASKVRLSIEMENWKNVQKLVPESTYKYLESSIERVKAREDNKDLWHQAINYIKKYEKIVLCGLGKDAESLMQYATHYLNEEDIAKLEFYDQRAGEMNYIYNGKRVISFEKLLEKYSDYYMLITSRKFKREIFYLMVNSGIDARHIFMV